MVAAVHLSFSEAGTLLLWIIEIFMNEQKYFFFPNRVSSATKWFANKM